MNKLISMSDFEAVLNSVNNAYALYRAKSFETGEWIYGFYVEKALTAGSKVADFALKIPNCYPVEIVKDTLCRYVPDLKSFENDWLTAKTNTSPVSNLEGFLTYNFLEYCIEQNDNTFPVCSFAAIDILTVQKTGKNTIDNPELKTEE